MSTLRYLVYFEPYRLDAGHVGERVFQPVFVRAHRSRREARKTLIRLIRGTDPRARDYLRSVHGNPFPVALRYYAQENVAPFVSYAPDDLR